jgi:hypothetical protein
MMAVVESGAADAVAAVLRREGETVAALGEVVEVAGGAPRVSYRGRLDI